MPPFAQMSTANATMLPEVRANFIDALEGANSYYNEVIESLIDDFQMESRLEKQGYWEKTGTVKRWDQGTSIPQVTMRQKMYLMGLHNWGAEMVWSVYDARDSKASIAKEATTLADDHLTLLPRLFAQILEGSANPDLKDTIETAVDGSSLYSSSTRFGVSGGNIESISDVTSSLLAYENIWKFHNRFQQFLTPNSTSPLLSPSEYDDLVIFVHPSKKQYWFEAAKAATKPVLFGTDAGAGVENLLAGKKVIGNIEIVPFIYLSGTADVYAFAAKGKYKAILRGRREGLEEYMFGPHNSLECARNMIETYQASQRWNLRAHFAQYTIKGDVA